MLEWRAEKAEREREVARGVALRELEEDLERWVREVAGEVNAECERAEGYVCPTCWWLALHCMNGARANSIASLAAQAQQGLASYITAQRVAVDICMLADGMTVEIPHVPRTALDVDIPASVECLLQRPMSPLDLSSCS